MLIIFLIFACYCYLLEHFLFYVEISLENLVSWSFVGLFYDEKFKYLV
jgi:hypothetical protein